MTLLLAYLLGLLLCGMIFKDSKQDYRTRLTFLADPSFYSLAYQDKEPMNYRFWAKSLLRGWWYLETSSESSRVGDTLWPSDVAELQFLISQPAWLVMRKVRICRLANPRYNLICF